MTIFNTLDKYWLAGLFEGEACFSLHKGKLRKDGLRRQTASLQINMVDKDVLEHAGYILGSKVNGPYAARQEGNKEFYVINIGGWKAVAIMTQLVSLMGERRQQRILEVITAHGTLLDPNE